jgi:DNA-binding NtrC family response regulator
VLLVEDEPALLGALRRVLERARPDAVVVYAADATTAEWQLRSTTVRFVVTDLRMNSDDRAGMRVVDAACEAGVAVAVLTGTDSDELEELKRRNIPIVSKQKMTNARLAELVERAFVA